MTSPVPDALRTQLAEVIRAAAERAEAVECDMTVPGEHAEADCPSCSSPLLPFATVGGVVVSVYADVAELLDLLAPTIAAALARARVEGAAEALREAADEVHVARFNADKDPDARWPVGSPQKVDSFYAGCVFTRNRLRDRAAALSAPTTTEGDPA